MTLTAYREQTLELSYSFWKSQVLHAAVRLDIFETLGAGWRRAEDVARRSHLQPRAVLLFLNALVALGFAEKKGRAFRNTRWGRQIFLKGEKLYVGDIVKLNASGWQPWGALERSLRTGRSLGLPPFFSKGYQAVRGFIMAMDNTAVGHCDRLVRQVSLKGKRALLDLGGGSGAYSIAFLRRYRQLRATLFDLPLTVRVAKPLIKKEGLSPRFDFQTGDFLKQPFRGSFDAVFLSHIIHGLNERENQKLFRKIHRTLEDGGLFIIQDFFLNPNGVQPSFAAMFALNMLIHTRSGRSYTACEIMAELRRVGFKSIRHLKSNLPRDISLITALK